MGENSILNAVMQNSTFGYTYNKILLDKQGNPCDYIFLDVNKSYEDMIGVTRDRIIGRKVSEVIPLIEEDSFRWIECFGKVALSGEKIEFEAYSKSVNRWFHMSISSPEHLYFVGISFDITEKKEMELKLAQSEETNRRYVENAPDGIFITDASGRYLRANIAACRMLAYEENEIKGRMFREFVIDDSVNGIAEYIKSLNRDGSARTIRQMRKKDGSAITVMVDAVALQGNQYMAFCKDISDSIRLKDEKEQYFNVFSSINQPILITDSEMTIIAVNDAFTEMYGYSREELLNSQPTLINSDIEDLNHRTTGEHSPMGLFDSIRKSVIDPSRRKWEGIIINRRKDGSLIWVDFLVNGVFDANGQLTSIICFPIDVTQRRELEDKNRIKLYQTIADLAELRDDETGNHMRRVGIFAKLVAREYRMGPQYSADIELFAPLHDIGKVGILDSILRAPRRLTPEEFEIMKSHTFLGYNIVKGKPELEMAAEITLFHHERFDGSGYPMGISGSNIPLSAQITALCDVYDALRSPRPYKEGWTHEAAVSCIEHAQGTQFNPELVGKFMKIKNEFEDIYRKFNDAPSPIC